jgi:hypothetical protein
LADAHAVRALATGEADADQQKRALRWIVRECCGYQEPSYLGQGEADTAHRAGRRHVGVQIEKMVNMPASVLAAMRKSDVGNAGSEHG